MYDHFDGPPCTNCESEPTEPDSLFCSGECQDEYEGVGAYAEPDTIQELEMQ